MCFNNSFASIEKSKYWSNKNKVKPIQVFTTRPTINPRLSEITQTPIPILTPQPIENKDFMLKNTIIFLFDVCINFSINTFLLHKKIIIIKHKIILI